MNKDISSLKDDVKSLKDDVKSLKDEFKSLKGNMDSNFQELKNLIMQKKRKDNDS